MAWTSAHTSTHTGSAVPLIRGGAEMPHHHLLPWQRFDGEQAPLATFLRAACACGWRSESSHPIQWIRTVDHNEQTLRQEWAAHAAEAAGGPAAEQLRQLQALLADLAVTDPRAALTAAAAMERAALPILTAAADAARSAGDSWTHIGAALGTTRQSAHERLAKSSP